MARTIGIITLIVLSNQRHATRTISRYFRDMQMDGSAIREKIEFLLFVLIYRFLLDISFVLFENVQFHYSGYNIDFSYSKYLISTILIIFLALQFPTRLNRLSDLPLFVALLTPICPMLVLFAWQDRPAPYVYLVVLSYTTILWLRQIRFPVPLARLTARTAERVILTLSLVIISGACLWIIYVGRLEVFVLNPADLYEYRRDLSALYNIGPFLYIIQWAGKLFTPLLCTIGLMRRNNYLIIVAIFAGIFLYGSTTNKQYLVWPFVPLLMYFLSLYRKTYSKIILSIIMSMFFSIFLYYKSKFIWAGSILIDRAIFSPAINNFYYFDFLSRNDPIFYSNKLLSSFFPFPYGSPIDIEIGAWRWGFEVFANTGVFGTSVIQLGYIGLVIYAIIISIILSIIDSIAMRSSAPVWVLWSVLFVPITLMLTSADLSISLLSNGILLGIILIWLFPSRESQR